MSPPPVLFLQSLTSCHNLTLASETLTHHTLHLANYPICGNIDDCFTSNDGLIMREAGPRVSLLAIEGQHMTSQAQVYNGATWIGAVKSVNHEIDTVRILLGGGVHACASFNFHPHLQGILLRSGSQGG